MRRKLHCVVALWAISLSLNSQNLLDTSTWTIGSGSVLDFNQNGATSENSRELGRNHIGEEVVLWKATPDGDNHACGGWTTGWHAADHSISYRFSVWLKKTNSHDGYSYLGFYADNSGSLRLDGTYNSNPYFWHGDLPKLNRWYLVVGYVHNSSHTGTTNLGGIYDGVTGEKVVTITDYKLSNLVTSLRHRSYLFYDTNTLDRQYFYAPRIDPINGNEPSIEELLRINEESKLVISYDVAGNQTESFYCGDPSYCSPTAARRSEEVQELTKEEAIKEIVLDNYFDVYPNPTSRFVTVKLGDTLLKNIHSIKLYNTNSVLIKSIVPDSTIQLDLTNLSSGVYFIHIHVNNGRSVTKKIVKR